MPSKYSPTKRKDADGLLPRHRRFVTEYLKDWNGTRAAIRAGYSRVSAAETASEILSKSNVKAVVKKALESMQLSAEQVLARLGEQATANINDFLGKDAKQTLKERGYLVKRIKRAGKGVEIELYDAQAALVHIGKHHGVFAERVEVTGPQGGPQQHEFTINMTPDELAATRPKPKAA